ncbi:hypothetical protein LY90DRAFT_515789 [Neocallimastix californiae]|uniref:Uncharacterized protein n=1 Tax=Neocallimastix californiae TaxID=1754190 RepID=A0A1Y2AHI8_9FUNG|nr:hypothetical protein LY90DRAFT_515789 [Neocallimastix californiae]|eukprot:ORY21966.1 hypothetical protein LY90DRAFT_515789 [Neocallimastix californiae]
MTEELIKNQNKIELVLNQFQFIQILSDTNKDVDKETWKGVKLAEKRINLAKAFSTKELIDEVENECGKRTRNSNGNSSYNQKFNSCNNKNFNNNPVTYKSRNNLNNDGNKEYFVDAAKRKVFSLDAGKEIRKAKANTVSKSGIFQKDEEEKDEVEEEIDLSKRKILKPKVNNNHVINDNKLNKDEEIKNYIDKNNINKESIMCDDKNIGVINKNKIIDNNIKIIYKINNITV